VNCGSPGPQCQFTVTGWSAYVGSGLQIRVLIFPVRPSGGGWFTQSPAASTEASGDWNQAPADLGAPGSPASSGDTLKLEAVVVRPDATYNGVPLGETASRGMLINDPRQISGLVGQSEIVSLRVQR
jgi:hypothetical protein